ncbi:MAG TPA: MFS transporter [Candidatus Dormibacteraeota bacterium]|nr:MFS transporter [Candidatus Dormibacteraeota bacterium]
MARLRWTRWPRSPTPTFSPLWRHPEFLKFWAGQSVSLFGTQFSLLAIPLAAALTLHASSAQMGFLAAAQFAPALVLGPFIGVWLDRARRRPVMVATQLASMAALATVPIAAVGHLLTLAQLYTVAFLAGAASAAYSVAQSSFLPTLVGREHLVEANAKFQTSRTIAQLAGPGIAGWVIQLITAPLAIAFDAATFLVAALTAAWIRTHEEVPAAAEARRHVLSEARHGLSFLWEEPLVRSVSLILILANFGSFFGSAVFVLLFVGHLGVTPAQLGLVWAIGSLSSLFGAQLAKPVARRLGLGPVLVTACILYSAGGLGAVAAAFAARPAVLPLLVANGLVTGLALMTFNVSQQAIRQAVIPNRLLGRTQAGLLVLVYGGQVLASLAGGALGQVAGLRTALVVGAALVWLSVLPAVFSPLRRLPEVPGSPETVPA